jgi:glycine dehydrogenase
MASMYAVYHGPDGLTAIASRVHERARSIAGLGDPVFAEFFDTVQLRVRGRAAEIVDAALDVGINLRLVDEDTVGIACDEVTTDEHLDALREILSGGVGSAAGSIPESLRRDDQFLTHPVFHQHHSETAMLRYLRRLADKDVALDRSMIPLGSCTMKLNAAAEMEPVTWRGFADVHPFAPLDQVAGYRALIADLEQWLADITGYDAVSVQPNAGSQGELAGLLAIREWHRANGDESRDVCLIPSSAHGTNAASAVMAGMRVVVVACDDHGNVDLDDLHAKLDANRSSVAALMVTYPSTHGVFEESIGDVYAAVHEAGGQVYVDGANLNALVGLAQPGTFGADVSHLNLHKTFCIPHGGGGPGVGPVAARSHLAPYLPNHPLVAEAGPSTGPGPVSAAPWGSAGILAIPWAYIRLMGGDGLRRATEVAILNANYVAKRLGPHYPVLYTGRGGLVAHECIVDIRPITKATGVTVDDVAKRLVDYGVHAPTMSFPVAGTLMIEPTESEDLGEIDRFCDAMIAIRAEIDQQPELLRNAPHTAAMLLRDPWEQPYTREQAAYPVPTLRTSKYWPPVRRIDGGYDDRNLMCACPPVESYE